MNYTAIAMAIISGVLSIGAVSLFFKNNIGRISRWIALAKDVVETLNDVSVALMPDDKGKVELTADEITKIQSDATQFKLDLAALLGK